MLLVYSLDVKTSEGRTNILVVHELSYRDSPVFEFHEFSEAFQAVGFDVLIVDLKDKRKAGYQKKMTPVGVRKERMRSREGTINVWTPFVGAPKDFLRPIAVLSHIMTLFLAIKQFRPAVIFSYSVPTSGLTVAILGKVFRIPVVHRSIDVSHLLRPGVFSPIVKISEKLTFQFSDYVSTHNQALADYAIRNGANADRVFIHYPPVDLEHFSNLDRASLITSPRIIFVGTLFEFCGLDKVIDSAKSLTETNRDWKLRIVGDGPVKKKLQAQVSNAGLSGLIEFRGWVDYQALPDELRWANVAINSFEKNLLTDCALPQKAVQYLASGLNVVSTNLHGSRTELENFRGVFFVDSPSKVLDSAISAAGIGTPTSNDVVEQQFGHDAAIRTIVGFISKVSV